MAFNPQIINPLDFDESVAIGVDIPFNGNAVFKSNFQTKNAIKNNIINYFLTNPGDRFLNPTFGAGLRDFVFTQINSDNLDFLKEIPSERFEIIVSNPPYIPLEEMKNVMIDVKEYEPEIALTDYIDGLRFYERFAELGPKILRSSSNCSLFAFNFLNN